MMLWGFLFPTVKKGYAVFGAEIAGDFLTFAGVRFLICGAVICVYALAKNKSNFKALKGNMVLVLLVGFLAGPLAYGVVGFLVGPLILGVTYTVLDNYRKEYLIEG